MITNEAPLVSVVIPTYNHGHFLGHALRSVLDQTYENWEVIIIDNHSQDNTDEVVNSFVDPRITLLKIHNNGVIAASRNLGILAAKGKWIAFLDSDDLWYPKKLDTVIKSILENPSIDVFSTDEILVNQITGNRRLLKYGPYCFNFYKRLMLMGNCLSTSATLVKREFLEKNNILFRENKEFVTAEDYDLWLLLAWAGAKFKFIHSVQGVFLIHATNNSGQIERHEENIVNVIKDHVYKIQSFQTNKNRLWRNIKVRLLLTSCKNMIEEKQFFECIHQIVLALQSSFVGSFRYLFFQIYKKLSSSISFNKE